MPAGRYVVLGDDGEPVGSEEFRCAPGPAGWRYFSDVKTVDPVPHDEVVDIVVDAGWLPLRFRAETGAHRLMLEASDTHLSGFRDGRPIETPWSPQMHLDYLTPATNLVTTKRLTETSEIEVVFVSPFTLEPTAERQRYERLGDEAVDTAVGRFAATRWRYTSLGDGWTSDLWVAGDIVVKYERLFELQRYDPGATGPVPAEHA
jgi:hypothetical protein